MKRVAAFCVLLTLVTLLAGCTKASSQKHSASFTGTFDTVITLIGYTASERAFNESFSQAQARMVELNNLFDIYHTYDGLNNVKTINDHAGISPVKVDQALFELLLYARKGYDQTGGALNIALGPVLSIWHNYREQYKGDPDNAKVPTPSELFLAGELTDIKKLVLDEANSTAFLTEKGMSLDLGALAKGYAAELVAQELAKGELKNFILDAGGNVITVGAPEDGRNYWVVGIQDPDDMSAPPIETLYIRDKSAVTSGDYQRFYVAEGKSLHHIIDPWTLMPAIRYRSVTVIGSSSLLCDMLSTSLFVLPRDTGEKLALELGFEAIWRLPDGTTEATTGAKTIMKSQGATN